MSNKYELTTTDKYGLGNIDLTNRPVVTNDDGSISTVRSMSFSDGVNEILVPTIVNGKLVSDDEAIQHYYDTGEYLGKFNSIEDANAYAEQLHKQQELLYRRLNMDSEAPNYASWIPEAGGYVANGKVVSKSPIYEDGKLKLDVDTSVFGNTAITTPGIQSNAEGSGQDVNSALTNAGSLGSLNNNTENSEYGVLNTPATTSPNVAEPELTPSEKFDRDFEYGVATDNIKMQIDALTGKSQLDGVDRSSQINQLYQKRNKKITDTDTAYGQAITEAYMNGDYERVAQLQAEQAQWREMVGFGEVQKTEYQQKQEDLVQQFDFAYQTGLNDISNALINMYGQFLNFQYNPATDPALNIAQGYAKASVKETMNATGMYDSSMTQRAITKAVSELVPVYEKMAKEEMKENITMLMSLGNYLMNLEQSQFNLWKGQIDVQLQLNQEKRNQYKDAMDRANAWGYVSNEDAVILGVAPGSPSPQAMQEARSAQQKLDEQQRDLYSKLVVADYTNTLNIQKMKAEKYLDDYYKSQQDYQNHLYDMELQALKNKGNGTQPTGIGSTPSTALSGLGFSDDTVTKFQNYLDGDYTATEVTKFFNDSKLTKNSFDDKTRSAIRDALKEELTELTKDGKMLPKELIKNGAVPYIKDKKDLESTLDVMEWMLYDEANAQLLNIATQEKAYTAIDEAIGNNFGKDYSKTNDALEEALKKADEYALSIKDTNYRTKNEEIKKVYEHIADKINGASYFDNSWIPIDDYNVSKEQSENYIVKRIRDNKLFGDNTDEIANSVETYIKSLQAGNRNEDGSFKTENRGDSLISKTGFALMEEANNAWQGLQNAINSPEAKYAGNVAKDVLTSSFMSGPTTMPISVTQNLVNLIADKIKANNK